MNRTLFTAAIAGALAVAGAAQAAGDAATGKNDAASCAGCHGPNGQGTQIAPKIAGMRSAAFVQALQDFKSGKRDNAMMKAQASNLTLQQMQDLAAYFSSLR
jgi:cytochrome c553